MMRTHKTLLAGLATLGVELGRRGGQHVSSTWRGSVERYTQHTGTLSGEVAS